VIDELTAATRAAGAGRLPTVVHMTSAHPVRDNRIFEKECRTLAEAGLRVVLVAQHDRDTEIEGVHVRAVPRAQGRLERFLLTSFRVFKKALAEPAAVYHVHDPDLVPWAVLLRLLRRRPVVYDVHEDYATGLAIVPYLPRPLGRVAGALYALMERLVSGPLTIVVAERYYLRRLPGGVPVLNYPRLDAFRSLPTTRPRPPAAAPPRLLYTGNLSFDRGALACARLMARLPEGTLDCIGRCWPDVAAAMRAICPDESRLRLVGVGEHVPYERILEAYARPWTAGLALFADTAHSREKEITKLFEYMAAGLPVICSNFPVWRELVEGNGAGICVGPEDTEAAVRAVDWLAAHPEAAARMGEAGRKAVRERYSWASQADTLLGLYRCLSPAVAGRAPAA
jgi:glycosyltransferase involved in cell wall biosynthesis